MVERTAYILALIALIAGLSSAWSWAREDAGKEDASGAAIVALLETQQDDWNRGDIRAFMVGYWNSPELTFAGSRGFMRGWQPVLERYEQTYADRAAMGKLDFSELEVRPLGQNAALVLGRWHLQRQIGDIGGIFTLVLQKFPEGWRIVHDHTTQSPPEPPERK